MSYHFSYESLLAASQAANWRIEDIIGEGETLDFSKPFMPESFARVGPIACLSDAEKLKLNQIRGCGYLYTFGLAEEFILPFVMDHARSALHVDDARTRALLQFAGEEAKHIDLFHRFYDAFVQGFGTRCGMIGPAEAISQAVLAHHPLGIGMVTLHIEWMTQKHFTESVRDAQDLDPLFRSVLKHHWAEEMQHAQLDEAIVRTLAAQAGPEEVEAGFQDFLKIAALLDGGLMQQLELDIESLQAAIGRELGEAEREEIRAVQRQAIRYTYLGSGLVHPRFLAVMEEVRPGSREELLAMAPAFS
ncbi:MAG: diiron oxygenase [Phenylobacterium sp.]|jgi:hypothetical protein|uniref:diiron oxygenase n=1 Tax=Phenylobacterium sp. TaxID=1871053 RepID=UPI002A370F13|nr:diiron oxygenase [Phenylobacterium sp.]MDX9998267.1 diiron oxygenase [Phenylobacterium sp.]